MNLFQEWSLYLNELSEIVLKTNQPDDVCPKTTNKEKKNFFVTAIRLKFRSEA